MTTTQRIYGINGRYTWLRRRVWFWQRAAYERSGWEKSEREGNLRPMMIKRIDAQADMNKFMRDAIDAIGKSP